jgi:nitrile hydratase accessory protein
VSDHSRERVLEAAGPAAPPRRNGELLFAAPWESRVFGLALALHERGLFAWEEFRARLVAEIARAEAHHGPDEPWCYYACWLAALERLLIEKGLCAGGEIDARADTLATRPPGHDH